MSCERRCTGISIFVVPGLTEMLEVGVADEARQRVERSAARYAIGGDITPYTFEGGGTDMTMQSVEDLHLQDIEVASRHLLYPYGVLHCPTQQRQLFHERGMTSGL